MSLELHEGWEVAWCAPDACPSPAAADELDWLPAEVPGTAAAALRAQGRWRPGDAFDFDAVDWWFRCAFSAEPAVEGERTALAFDGLATVAEVYLNGELVLESESMFAGHRVDVSDRVRSANTLAIRCRALGPLLQVTRRPRARWRTRLVSERNLRFFRTMLLGRAPGFAPGPAAVGPWKPIRLERRRGPEVEGLRLRARLEDGSGRLTVTGRLAGVAPGDAVPPVTVRVSGRTGSHEGQLSVDETMGVRGGVVIADAALWWPHTHGNPSLYDVEIAVGERRFAAGRVGFRSLAFAGELETDGIQLLVNDLPVFARGAVWTPLDLADPHSSEAQLRPVLESVVDAGMNMLRVPGTGCYEGPAFHDLCDELGLLVWQDFMFANLDYPDRDEAFMHLVEHEAREVLDALGSRPSLAVLCGGSEVAQQAAMMGLDPRETGGPLYEELLPRAIAEADVDATYVPSTPWGGELPFRPDRGVANYYGVGAYLRPLTDARLSSVRFAGECLAFANVPDEEALEEMGSPTVHDPRWKAGVPRDAGAGWDFGDVRDHYLRELYGLDPLGLRYADHDRYLELSRHVTGEVMAEVFGEFRRRGSPCGGALVLWLTDLVPGAGWGLLDHRGRPKVAYHYLRRALAPRCVWTTDEGLGGVDIHVANDRPETLEATLRLATYQDLERPVEQVEQAVRVEPYGGLTVGVEALLGRFIDASWTYRFGPPTHDAIVVSLETEGGLISQAVRFPVARPLALETPERAALTARVHDDGGRITLCAARLLYGVRIIAPGFVPGDDAFVLEPGREREIQLRRLGSHQEFPAGHISAVNLRGRVALSH